MAKTCRMCRQCWTPRRRCIRFNYRKVDPGESCEFQEPRETPLLVDVLVEALKAMLTLPYRPLRSSPQQASRIDAIETNAKDAMSRYKEEVGDA